MTVNCVGCYRIVTVILHQINSENHAPNKLAQSPSVRFPRSIGAGVHRRGDAQMKNITRILASSTRMRKSFANFGNKLYPPGS